MTKVKLGWDSKECWPRHKQDPGHDSPGSPFAWGEDRLVGVGGRDILSDAYRRARTQVPRPATAEGGPLVQPGSTAPILDGA